MTKLGILVHNGNGFDCKRFSDLTVKKYWKAAKLTAKEEQELEKLTNQLKGLDFGSYLRARLGSAPKGMLSPHAHHVLFKLGLGGKQKELVAEGFDILMRNGVEPEEFIKGFNLVWAPNNIPGQHGYQALEDVLKALRKADGKGREAMKEILEEMGRIAAARGG